MEIRVKLDTNLDSKKIINIIELALIEYCCGMEVDEIENIPLESLVRQTSDFASDEICGCGGKIKSYGIAGEKYCDYCDKAY